MWVRQMKTVFDYAKNACGNPISAKTVMQQEKLCSENYKHIKLFSAHRAAILSFAFLFILFISSPALSRGKSTPPAKAAKAAVSVVTATAAFATATEVIHWAKIYGGDKPNWANSIAQTSDGGFIMAGGTESYGDYDSRDAWVLKLDASGTVVWSKPYGDRGQEDAWSVVQSPDGGFVFAGETDSFGAGLADAWIVKLDAAGARLWSRAYGGPGVDRAFSIATTKDGGYIVAGYTESTGAGKGDAWVLKLDADGYEDWQKVLGGPEYDSANSVRQTADGGYVAAGTTASFGAGKEDFWVVKLDANGNKLWDKTFGGADSDRAHSIVQTPDGGYAVAGESMYDADGHTDFRVFRLDPNGARMWDAESRGPGDTRAYSIDNTADGGFIFAGDALPKDQGAEDALVVKLDSRGKLKWLHNYGGTNPDGARCIHQTADGGFIFAGQTTSFGDGGQYAWAVKLGLTGLCAGCY